MDSKLTEVHGLMAKAEKCLKTSFFKRTPDYDSAIEFYTQAALIQKNCKRFQEAAELYTKVAELQLKSGSYFHCAKNYEAASMLYRELKDFDRMASLISEAGRLLLENGTPDSASYIYERAAKWLEQPLPSKAAQFYEKSANACQAEDKYHEAADQWNNASHMWVRLRLFTEAEHSLRQNITCTLQAYPDGSSEAASNMSHFSDRAGGPNLCARSVLVLILLKLHQEEEIAARKVFSEAVSRWRFNQADSYSHVVQLLDAVERGDSQAAAEIVKAPCFRTLDLDFSRLIKEIKFPSSDPVTSDHHGCSAQPTDVDGEEEEDIC